MTFVSPKPVTLQGCGVQLEPLTVAHAPELFAITPPGTFDYYLSWPLEWTVAGLEAWLAKLIANPKNVCFAIRRLNPDGTAGDIVGSSSYMDIDPPNACVEIGATWYTPAARGTSINPACKLLLLRHAFETLGCVRVTLKCDGRNLHSQRAIAKLGATREGTLRKHRIQQNGFVRETVMFSVIRDEWPTVLAGLEARTR